MPLIFKDSKLFTLCDWVQLGYLSKIKNILTVVFRIFFVIVSILYSVNSTPLGNFFSGSTRDETYSVAEGSTCRNAVSRGNSPFSHSNRRILNQRKWGIFGAISFGVFFYRLISSKCYRFSAFGMGKITWRQSIKMGQQFYWYFCLSLQFVPRQKKGGAQIQSVWQG